MKLQRSRERQADGRFRGLAAVISSVRKFAHGRVTARMRIGPNQAPGVVSAFITMSQLGDEIDFEWLAGKEPNQVSVNWFSRAIADYGRDTKCWINADPRYTFHDYSIEWTADKITWTVDGAYCKDIRKWDYPRGPEYPSGYLFPEEEPLVQFGIWDGGAGAAGTRDWAGGYIPWETAEGERGYEMTVQSVTIQCY
ncbi:concanavalin A-like lectin/glucanase domain-containing protein [Hyaloraphidium curvatum]|nr:concanavalin A-like lectin/glucanase domain-containing protein [Hyaloraphidium curvatum]